MNIFGSSVVIAMHSSNDVKDFVPAFSCHPTEDAHSQLVPQSQQDACDLSVRVYQQESCVTCAALSLRCLHPSHLIGHAAFATLANTEIVICSASLHARRREIDP